MNIKQTRGFTLIELMIVVAVIAIIAAVAIPNYQEYIKATRRGAATACLEEAAMRMNQRKASNLPYDTTTTFPAMSCITSITDNYSLSFAAGEPQPNSYIIQATPLGGQVDECGILTLNQLGVKSADSGSGNAALIKKCWK